MKEIKSDDSREITQPISFVGREEIMKELKSDDLREITQPISFGTPEEVMEELKSNDPWKIQPTTFEKTEKVKQLKIEDVEKNKKERRSLNSKKIIEVQALNMEDEVTKPISFVARERDQFGNIKEIEVDNPDLAGCILPTAMGGVKGFEKLLTVVGKRGEKTNLINNIIKNLHESKKEENEEKGEILANYALKPLVVYQYIDRKGKLSDSENEILIEILIGENDKIRKEFRLKFKYLNRITQEISQKFATAILYDKKATARNQIENDLREQLRYTPIVDCYTDAGWQKIKNEYIYVNKSMEIKGIQVMTELNLPYDSLYTPNDILEIWSKATSIYLNHNISSVLITYAFLGVAYKVFDESGYPPHFLLFITGKTGSFKTSIAKVLYTQLMEDKYRDSPRRIDVDTQTAFERGLVQSGVDTITLIDDFAPNKTRKKMNDMKDNLEMIIRMVGDGSTKSRSNANLEDCRGEGVKGMVALTGELKGNGLSSNLRCLFCEIEKGSVNLETLTWFQRQETAFTTLIFHFTKFLGQNWKATKEFIKKQFDELREEAAEHLKERRLIDTLVTLWIMESIIKEFLTCYCNGDVKKIENQIKSMQNGVEEVVIRSELLSTEQDLGKVFMRSVATMKSNGKLKIKEGRFGLMDLQIYDGFVEKEYIYFLPDNLFCKVDTWLAKGKMEFSSDIEQTEKMLAEEGYIELASNGSNRKTRYARLYIKDRRVKFLKFSKKAFEQFE